MKAKKPNASYQQKALRDKKMALTLNPDPKPQPTGLSGPLKTNKLLKLKTKLAKKAKPVKAAKVTLVRRPAEVSAAELEWRKHLGDLLGEEEVLALLKEASREAVLARSRQGDLLALDTKNGRYLYPVFQFREDGQPFPILTQVLAAFRDAVESVYTVASWLVSPNPFLEQMSPVIWMKHNGDDRLLLEAARRTAARLAR